jgi:hypothetical protein
MPAPAVENTVSNRPGAEPVDSTPSDFARFIKDELEKWTNVARVANIKPE